MKTKKKIEVTYDSYEEFITDVTESVQANWMLIAFFKMGDQFQATYEELESKETSTTPF